MADHRPEYPDSGHWVSENARSPRSSKLPRKGRRSGTGNGRRGDARPGADPTYAGPSRQSSTSSPTPQSYSPTQTSSRRPTKSREQSDDAATLVNSPRTSSSPDLSSRAEKTERISKSDRNQRSPKSSRIPQFPGAHPTYSSVAAAEVDDSHSPRVPPSPSSTNTSHRLSSSVASASSTISDPPSPTPPSKGTRRSIYKKRSQDLIATMDKPIEEKTQPEQGAKDESFVHVSEAPTIQMRSSGADAPSNADEKAHDQNASTGSQSSEKTMVDSTSSEVHNGVSFAEALMDDNAHSRNGHTEQNGQRDDSEARSDDSYPELDEMTINDIHTHQPAPQHQPYGKIRWAPFNVPAKRRLQTSAVLMHCLSIGAMVSLFFAFCANPFAWPLLLIYLVHVLISKAHVDGSLKYRSEWFRSSYIWDLFAGYFPARLHKTHDLPPTRKYIFGYHPHGIISHGAWAAFATDALGFSEKFPGITNSLLTLESNFRLPFYRDYILAMGVRSVSKESIVNILTKGGQNGEGMGRAVTIVVGGARESLEAQPGHMRLILKDRKGFIKIAVRTGADLVPVVAFGENDLYDQLRPKEHPMVHKIQMFVLKVWKFTLPFLHGRGIFNYDVGLMPYRAPLNVVVGAPIKVHQSNHVDEKEIDRLHGLYVEEVEKLWDRYKDEFAGGRKEELQILH
ncbi:hypothetical protein JX265_006258 [Neoarthrinium moseri]|uniref:diacylglycerol O-acyltransferase n=1 Tax=Neoarthrinium moseri TaxID=1658444 RepID=A0A9P9WLR6_9PEZI|nr:hypothetical protein JX265_006258 [Neoarthrinium moseri]